MIILLSSSKNYGEQNKNNKKKNTITTGLAIFMFIISRLFHK